MSDQAEYDIFISYARKDNSTGWVTAIRDHIVADHAKFSPQRLRIFFDTLEIKDADDWRLRILGALRKSRILLVCLSPSYFASEYCIWEWKEYIARQVHQLMGSESIATIYFVEVPGSPEHANARQLAELMRGNYTDLRPFFDEGILALQKADVRARMARLGETLHERLMRARRALSVPGNLRWQNPYFVGRSDELHKLHHQLGTGAVGVVTAVHGLGGQGKTELAVAYAHGWADCYPAGLWSLGAEGATELLPLIGKLAWEPALHFTPNDAEKADPALLGRAVLEHLKSLADAATHTDRGAACLILLDNVSEHTLLSPAQLATLPGGMSAGWLRIVATTRLDLTVQKDRLALLAVDALDADSSLLLIRDHQPERDGVPQFTSPAEEDAARHIIRALGGFTLAIEQVALHLGLHHVQPSTYLSLLTASGLPHADTLGAAFDIAGQMQTQARQLTHILRHTLALLPAPALTALHLAAHLPPDTVPWPWLRELTIKAHPSLATPDAQGTDPWLTIQRRLTGLRLLTPGDHLAVARIHRLIAAHLLESSGAVSWWTRLKRAIGLEGQRPGDIPAQGNALGSPGENASSPEGAARSLDTHLAQRADAIYRDQAAPADWELDSLILALPHRLEKATTHHLANPAVFLADKLITYRTLPTAATFIATVHRVLTDLAASDPANAAWQSDLSISQEKLGNLAVAQGDLPGALRRFTDCLAIRERLAASDPANAEWQRDLSVSHAKLGDLAVAQGDLPGALRRFTDGLAIAERLAASDPANAAWQRDLSVSHNKLGDLAVAQGDLPGALRRFTDGLAIRERLAARDPANAEWQRDLAVSHFKLSHFAQKSGDEAMMRAELHACFTVLDSMKRRGLHMDPPIANLHAQLAPMFTP